MSDSRDIFTEPVVSEMVEDFSIDRLMELLSLDSTSVWRYTDDVEKALSIFGRKMDSCDFYIAMWNAIYGDYATDNSRELAYHVMSVVDEYSCACAFLGPLNNGWSITDKLRSKCMDIVEHSDIYDSSLYDKLKSVRQSDGVGELYGNSSLVSGKYVNMPRSIARVTASMGNLIDTLLHRSDDVPSRYYGMGNDSSSKIFDVDLFDVVLGYLRDNSIVYKSFELRNYGLSLYYSMLDGGYIKRGYSFLSCDRVSIEAAREFVSEPDIPIIVVECGEYDTIVDACELLYSLGMLETEEESDTYMVLSCNRADASIDALGELLGDNIEKVVSIMSASPCKVAVGDNSIQNRYIPVTHLFGDAIPICFDSYDLHEYCWRSREDLSELALSRFSEYCNASFVCKVMDIVSGISISEDVDEYSNNVLVDSFIAESGFDYVSSILPEILGVYDAPSREFWNDRAKNVLASYIAHFCDCDARYYRVSKLEGAIYLMKSRFASEMNISGNHDVMSIDALNAKLEKVRCEVENGLGVEISAFMDGVPISDVLA